MAEVKSVSKVGVFARAIPICWTAAKADAGTKELAASSQGDFVLAMAAWTLHPSGERLKRFGYMRGVIHSSETRGIYCIRE